MSNKDLAKQYVEEAPYHPGYEDAVVGQELPEDSTHPEFIRGYKVGYDAGMRAGQEFLIKKTGSNES